MLTFDGCQARQQRLLRRMEANGWDLFLTGNYRTVYYFTGALTAAEIPAAFAMDGAGRTVLVSGFSGDVCCDELRKLETYSIQRSLDNLGEDAAALLADFAWKGLARGAVEKGTTSVSLATALKVAEWADATSTIL